MLSNPALIHELSIGNSLCSVFLLYFLQFDFGKSVSVLPFRVRFWLPAIIIEVLNLELY